MNFAECSQLLNRALKFFSDAFKFPDFCFINVYTIGFKKLLEQYASFLDFPVLLMSFIKMKTKVFEASETFSLLRVRYIALKQNLTTLRKLSHSNSSVKNFQNWNLVLLLRSSTLIAPIHTFSFSTARELSKTLSFELSAVYFAVYVWRKTFCTFCSTESDEASVHWFEPYCARVLSAKVLIWVKYETFCAATIDIFIFFFIL